MEAPLTNNTRIDYLTIGHVSEDLVSDSRYILGGTVSYSAQTAKILQLKAGIVTSASPDADLSELRGIPIVCRPASRSTTFENRYGKSGRTQYIHHLARNLSIRDVPELWQSTPIIHLGPIAREIDANMVSSFEGSFVCLTPQGWLREWDENGLISHSEWKGAFSVLPRVNAVVLSIEDVAGDWGYLEKWAECTRVLAVTLGEKGATVFHNGIRVQLEAPKVKVVDPTGAGDVFASAFFIRLFQSNNPVSSGRFAVSMASSSVEHHGLRGVTDRSIEQ